MSKFAVTTAKSSRRTVDIFLNVVERSDWQASEPTEIFELITRPKHIVIHHTGFCQSSGSLNAAKRVVQTIQRLHMSRRLNPGSSRPWSDIGYNFVNTVDGILLEGRAGSLAAALNGNSVRGAHTGTADGNCSIGICNEGNFMTEPMSSAQWNSLVEICAALCQSCNIAPELIRGHRDFVSTACPGQWLYDQLPRLKGEVVRMIEK